MYEESLHTPLLVRWPNRIKPQSKNDLLVSNLDFAPTFLELAGAKPAKDMQGESLLPLFKGNTPKHWRMTHYYHYYEAGGHGVPIHYGVTDGKQKLIRFPDDTLNTWEFFDLQKDPMEMKNLYAEKSKTANIEAMKKELHRLRKLYKIEE